MDTPNMVVPRRHPPRGHRLFPLALAISASAATVLGASGQAAAATVQVNGTCTLGEAIQTVNNQVAAPGCSMGNQAAPAGCTYTTGANVDLIIVPSGTFTQTGELTLTRGAWVCGNGVGVTTLRGNSTSSHFLVVFNLDPNWETAPPMTVTFERMTIDHTAGGSTVTGIYASRSLLRVLKARVTGFGNVGIWAEDSDLIVDDSIVENNWAVGSGGGIYFNNQSFVTHLAAMHINRSTISNNHSGASGGGVFYYGDATSDLVNTTVSGNFAVDGGGIAKGYESGQYLFLYYTTVAKNTATSTGGGASTLGGPSAQGIKLDGSIIGKNVAPTGPDVFGFVNQFKDSIIGTGAGATIPAAAFNNGSLQDPQIDETLTDLGGPFHTKVHRLLPNSPAIDGVLTPATAVAGDDQRKVARPQLGRSNSSRTDMGAVEMTRLETEALSAPVATAAHLTVGASQYSNGQGKNLQANGINNYVVYATPASLPSGTHNITIGYKKGSNAGKFQVAYGASSAGPWTTIGGTQDGYSLANSWVTVNLGTASFASTSVKYFRFFVTDKNASSTSYQVFPDFIEVTRP